MVTQGLAKNRDPKRTEKLRIAVRYLLQKESMVEGVRTGLQSGLAKHFKVSRQRVHQVVVEERTKIETKME